jgi:hypothetical protein
VFARADHMKCETDKIRAAWAGGDRIGALRVAARFFDRSADTLTFKRGMDAHNNPGFYRQLGKEPQELVKAALDVLAKRFALPWPVDNVRIIRTQHLRRATRAPISPGSSWPANSPFARW